MDNSRLVHHPLPILTYMAEAHAPGGGGGSGLPNQLAQAPLGMPPPPEPVLDEDAQSVTVSDADMDKHMIAKSLARLPEPYSNTDLDLLWRTLAAEAS